MFQSEEPYHLYVSMYLYFTITRKFNIYYSISPKQQQIITSAAVLMIVIRILKSLTMKKFSKLK